MLLSSQILFSMWIPLTIISYIIIKLSNLTLNIHICLLKVPQRLCACLHAVNHSVTVGDSLTVSGQIFQRVPRVLLLALHEQHNAWLMQIAPLLRYNQWVRRSHAPNDDLHTHGHQLIHSQMFTQPSGNDVPHSWIHPIHRETFQLTDHQWSNPDATYCSYQDGHSAVPIRRYIRKINANKYTHTNIHAAVTILTPTHPPTSMQHLCHITGDQPVNNFLISALQSKMFVSSSMAECVSSEK